MGLHCETIVCASGNSRPGVIPSNFMQDFYDTMEMVAATGSTRAGWGHSHSREEKMWMWAEPMVRVKAIESGWQIERFGSVADEYELTSVDK